MTSQMRKILAILLIVSIATTALVTISIIVFGQVDRLELKIILSLLAFTGILALALACTPREHQNRWLASTSLSVISITLILTLSEIWSYQWTLAFWQCIGVAWVVSIVCAYLCILLFRQVSRWVKLVRVFAMVSIVLWAGILIASPFDFKTIAGLTLISTGSALIVLIASWLKC